MLIRQIHGAHNQETFFFIFYTILLCSPSMHNLKIATLLFPERVVYGPVMQGYGPGNIVFWEYPGIFFIDREDVWI